MDVNPLLLPYLPLVEYLGQAFGENCEVILHDLTNVEHSIVAISNGHITNRQVGGHITDFGLEVAHNPRYQDKDFAVNYPGYTPDRSRTLKSSTYFIRDGNGVTIGLLCLNIDVTDLLSAKRLLGRLSGTAEEEAPPAAAAASLIQETFTASVEDTMNASIDRILAAFPVAPQRLTVDEKKAAVERLQARGLFALKGGVGLVARRLDVSEQTVYRYLRDITQSDK